MVVEYVLPVTIAPTWRNGAQFLCLFKWGEPSDFLYYTLSFPHISGGGGTICTIVFKARKLRICYRSMTYILAPCAPCVQRRRFRTMLFFVFLMFFFPSTYVSAWSGIGPKLGLDKWCHSKCSKYQVLMIINMINAPVCSSPLRQIWIMHESVCE